MADTGFKSPTTTGSPLNEWTNPSNAFSSNNSYATAALLNRRQDYATFVFGIPAGATINGILVNVEMLSTAIAQLDGESAGFNIDLSWDGGTTYTAVKSVEVFAADPEQVYAFGGAADTWGRTFTDTEFSTANFRLRIRYVSPSLGDFNPGVDHIQCKVFYTEAPAAGGAGKSGPLLRRVG